MNYSEFKPKHPLLRPYIEYYNSMQGNGTEGKKFISLPEGKIGMVFMLSGNSKVFNGETTLIIQTARIWGLIQKPNFVEISPDIFTFCVVFKPGGLFHFLPPIPMDEIAPASTTLEDIFGKDIARMEDALFECTTFEERIFLMEDFLLKNLHVPNAQINAAVQLIKNAKGNIKIKSLSEHLNISTRQLRNIFNEKIGLSPKQMTRMLRFNNALSFPPSENENMAQYANRLGYYDESHFIYEFKLFAGMTPSKYFKNLSFISDFSNFKRLMLD